MSDQEFDIIIVGGGTAGCLLAARLSTSNHLRILLLEAGADRNDDAKVRTPLTSRQMFGDPDYDWNLETEPHPYLDNRLIQQTRGRMLGGSSAINSHSLVYPNREMHNIWAKMAENERWSWKRMQDCYSRFADELSFSTGTISDSSLTREPPGAIKASFPKRLDQLQEVWEVVFDNLGMKARENGPSGKCFGGFTTTNAIDNRPGKGERSHAGIAFLQPVLHRNNLVVVTEARTTRILFRKNGYCVDSDQHTKDLTTSGVEYEKGGRKFSVLAKREVIISAGVFGSPQLLELSGIGGRDVLQELAIDCLIDLPGVGEYLQEHLNFGPSVEVHSNIETMDSAIRNPELMANHRKQYLENQTGPIAEGAAYSFSFWPLQLFNVSSEEADLQSLLKTHKDPELNNSRALHEDYVHRMIMSPEEASGTVFMTRMQRYTTPDNRADGNYMTVIAMLSHPLSVGSTHIRSADSHTSPRIDCGYMSHPLDIEILARHCLQIEQLLQQPVYHDIIKPNGRRLPHDFQKPFKDIEVAKSAIRKYGATNYHPCGTCAMVPRTDGGVVDGDLRVYGTTNLRICDASIFPIIPRGNILTTVYAVAEKAAEFLSQEYFDLSS